MNELKIINIDGVDCYEKDGTAYLKLETVARGLGFTFTAKSGNEVVRWNTVYGYLKDLGVATSCNGGSYQDDCPEYIPENIFYRLAMKAKNEVAEKFQAKVADEIIPAIRKTGGYQATAPQGRDLIALAVIEAQKIIDKQSTQIEEMKPHAVLGEAIATAKTSILVGDMAKILNQNGVNIGAKRFFQWLREHGYLIKHKGTDWNLPTQRSMDMGLFYVKESVYIDGNGSNRIVRTPKITGKGQEYFANKFLKK